MKLHITTGTLDYLSSMQERNPALMMNAREYEAMIYAESDEADSPFDSGADYTILHSHGTLSEENTVYVQYIPVSGSGNASVLGHFSDLNQKLQNINGLLSYRLGHSTDEGTYVVFTQWPKKSTIDDFQSSDVYRDYLTSDVLKKFRDAGSLFQNFSAAKVYLPVEENERNLEALSDEEKEDY